MRDRRASVDARAPSRDDFKAVMGRFATGVSVMTTATGGVVHGMTANAVSSVSMDPPLVLVCVERTTAMAERVAESGVFALSFLTADQADLSVWFADPARRDDRAQFDAVPYVTAATGAPVLAHCVGWLDCRVWATYDGGDHVVVLGEVLELGTGEAAEPLVYFRSEYGGFAP